MSFDRNSLDDYNDVASRIREFSERHPQGSLQPLNLQQPFEVVTIADQVFVVYAAAAYRTPDDARPGVGLAYEAFPGRTPYTKGSELQNAETAAWGRAIVAALAADTRKGVASAEEVRERDVEQAPAAEQPKPVGKRAGRASAPAAESPSLTAYREGLTALKLSGTQAAALLTEHGVPISDRWWDDVATWDAKHVDKMLSGLEQWVSESQAGGQAS